MQKFFTVIFLLLWVTGVFAQSDIIFFSDSPDPTFYDASWGYKSGASLLELVGVGSDKFPVDLQHPYQGAHSLRLHWTSAAGGDWGIAVASVGWAGHDLTKYDSLVYWINGPAEILQADLPDLSMEDLSNHRSSRVWLGDYFGGVDADTNSWQKVMIPLDAFQPGPDNCDFSRIKTIFHFQKTADGAEHLFWLDEIRAIQSGGSGPAIPDPPKNISATGYDSRIDLKWDLVTDSTLFGHYIYRSASPTGPFTRLNSVPHTPHIYSDFFGQNDQTYYYSVTALNANLEESQPSDTVSATSRSMTEEELLNTVEEAMFRYFYDYGHPVSGLARERKDAGDGCATGATGFGLMSMIVGADRGFVTREAAAERTLKILRFLQDSVTTYHGAWAHWINGKTGETIPFSQYDDGGDLVETAYLAQGLLTIRRYFNDANAVETEIRTRATQMWEGIEWDWYRRTESSNVLYWHWSPNYEWAMNMPVVGFNEAMIVYLLAIASPTHSVPAALYYDGWASPVSYENGNTYYNIMQWVGPNYGGPLFFTHYSFLGFDPRGKSDKFCNYFENNRNISLIHRAYSMANPFSYAGYDSLVWGLTASDEPGGYSAHAPFNHDNGTVTPTAAISAMPYVPDESIATLKHFYYVLGPQLWGEFGFKDAFNLEHNWFAQSYIGIDQGPMIIMMENYRSGLCWDMFMSNPEIPQMLTAIGWTVGIEDGKIPLISRYELQQNYPNPFNSGTIIKFNLPKNEKVNLQIFNVLGQAVKTIYQNQKLNAGEYTIKFQSNDLPTGIYFYRLQAGDFIATRKMLMVR